MSDIPQVPRRAATQPARPAAGYPVASYPAYPAYPVASYPTPGYPPQAPARQPGMLGMVALILALAAAVGASIVGAVAGVRIGPAFDAFVGGQTPDLATLTPVRGWVLLAESALWGGTALGVWAIVQGSIAMVKRRGFGTGLAAVIVAVAGAAIFFGVMVLALAVGAAAR